MANALKGEVDVPVGGKTYRMVYEVNSICEVEELLGRTWVDIAQELDTWAPPKGPDGQPLAETEAEVLARAAKVSTKLLRALVWGALREHHEDVTLKQAGSLMGEIEGGAIAVLSKLFDRSNPKHEPGGGDANPPQPGAAAETPSTGQASTAPGVA